MGLYCFVDIYLIACKLYIKQKLKYLSLDLGKILSLYKEDQCGICQVCNYKMGYYKKGKKGNKKFNINKPL